MPKRVIDGEALWTSDKLSEVQPLEYRAEFANLLPLSLANGVFECAPAKIFRAVYAYNRPDRTVQDVTKILDEFERVKMFFRWQEPDGKWWGHFVGVDKPGRLPADSRKDREKLGPEPPPNKLREFLNAVTAGYPEGSRSVQEGYPGKGTGSGSGLGSGSCFGSGSGYGQGKGSAENELGNMNLSTINHPIDDGFEQRKPVNPITTNLQTQSSPITKRKHVFRCEPEAETNQLAMIINEMLDDYPRPCPDAETRQAWFDVFLANIESLAKEFFHGDTDHAVDFLVPSFNKFREYTKKRGPEYAWAPARFFSEWVRKEKSLGNFTANEATDETTLDDIDADSRSVTGDNEPEAEEVEEEEDFG
jgi:hypothetical protein